MNDSAETSRALPSQLEEVAPTTSIHKSDLLDEGLDESFPASDPPAVNITRVVPAHSPRNHPDDV